MNKFNLTKKQIDAFIRALETSKRFITNVGAVGSGKTFLNNIIFLTHIKKIKLNHEEELGKYIIAGWSKTSVENNILSPLKNMGVPIKKRATDYLIDGVAVTLAYTGTSRGSDAIQGINALGAYINEAVISKQKVFEQINERVRVGSILKIIIDGNPENPSHWLKKKYIDEGLTEYTQFSIFDNQENLPSEYIKTLEKTNKGERYKRNVLGEWARGDDVFNYQVLNDYKIDEVNGIISWGVDWGGVDKRQDPNAFVKVKMDFESKRIYILEAYKNHFTLEKRLNFALNNHMNGAFVDTNEPSVNSFMLLNGWEIKPIKKISKKNLGFREFSINRLAEYEIFIKESLTDLIEEFDNFQRNEEGKLPDTDDHYIDAFRYATNGLINTLGGKR